MSIFSDPQKRKVGSNTFNLTHDRKTNFRIGEIVPIMVDEVLPGDKWHLKPSVMTRLAPMIAPVMHQLYMTVHTFFVPNRLLWDGWEEFQAGTQPTQAQALPIATANPGQKSVQDDAFWTNRVHPYATVDLQKITEGSLLDHLGLPVSTDVTDLPSSPTSNVNINILPLKAYDFIFDEYYRDRDLDLGRRFTKAVDGDNTELSIEDLTPRWRNYKKDYFTSARPWPQKGQEAMIPLGMAEVVQNLNGISPAWTEVSAPGNAIGTGPLQAAGVSSRTEVNAEPASMDPRGTLVTDGSTFDESSIVNLRRAIALQNFLEISNRFGGRYVEHVYGQFGVTSSDLRTMRPEYVGGYSSNVKFSEVLSTSGWYVESGQGGNQDSVYLPQGNMAGHGIGFGGGKQCHYKAEEHGIIMTLLTLLPIPGYQQGIPRLYLKNDAFDYALPAFAHIGEQAIWNAEVGVKADQTTEAQLKATWGYTPRYAEYKWKQSSVHGSFRSSMDVWHMNRKFSAVPALTDQYLQVGNQDDINRIFAVDPATSGEPPVWAMVLNEIKVSRKLPYFGNPKIT